MSRKNNVNPDYYKIRGRDRVNEDVVRDKIAPGPPRAEKTDRKPALPGARRAARNRETTNRT